MWFYQILQDIKSDELQYGGKWKGQSPHVNLALMIGVVKTYDPISFDDANNKQEWKDAMQVEYNALMKKQYSGISWVTSEQETNRL